MTTRFSWRPAGWRKRKRKHDDYYSGPRRPKRKRPAPVEPHESLEHKLVRWARAGWEWTRAHSREATAAGGAAALLLAAVIWYFVKRADQEEQSWLRLSTVVEETAMAAANVSPEDAARKFKRIQRDCGLTSATPFVELAMGNALYERGDYKGALEAFSRLGKRYRRREVGQLGLWGKAMAAEQLGRHTLAIAALKQLRKKCPEYLRTQAELDLARNLEAAGQDEEAVARYKAVLKMTSDSNLRAVANSRLERITQGRTQVGVGSAGEKKKKPQKKSSAH